MLTHTVQSFAVHQQHQALHEGPAPHTALQVRAVQDCPTFQPHAHWIHSANSPRGASSSERLAAATRSDDMSREREHQLSRRHKVLAGPSQCTPITHIVTTNDASRHHRYPAAAAAARSALLRSAEGWCETQPSRMRMYSMELCATCSISCVDRPGGLPSGNCVFSGASETRAAAISECAWSPRSACAAPCCLLRTLPVGAVYLPCIESQCHRFSA